MHLASARTKFIDTRFNSRQKNKKIVWTQVGSHCCYYWLVCHSIRRIK